VARADSFVEIDNLAPIQAGIDPANAAAFRAFQVGRNGGPVPMGHVRQIEPAVVMVTAVIVPLAANNSSSLALHP